MQCSQTSSQSSHGTLQQSAWASTQLCSNPCLATIGGENHEQVLPSEAPKARKRARSEQIFRSNERSRFIRKTGQCKQEFSPLVSSQGVWW